jgi:purine-nucleoside phosphorylase
MNPSPSPASLDETVFPLRERLRAAGASDPDVLFLLGTGAGFLPARLEKARELELGELCGECEPWHGQVLRTGRIGRLSVWLLEDVSGDPPADEPMSPWMRAMPVWLAAAAGATVCVHTSAGSALAGFAGRTPGFALVRDHLNVSGTTPLLGLGETKLGPLFPDLTHLHHVGLRGALLARAEALGLPAVEAVAALTLGPALETPAERVMLARLGAEVAVPGLALPLVAAGHAGLAVLAVVAVTDAGAPGADVRSVVAAAEALQPGLEDLLLAAVPDLESASASFAEEPA